MMPLKRARFYPPLPPAQGKANNPKMFLLLDSAWAWAPAVLYEPCMTSVSWYKGRHSAPSPRSSATWASGARNRGWFPIHRW